jgi:hypothetical protein
VSGPWLKGSRSKGPKPETQFCKLPAGRNTRQIKVETAKNTGSIKAVFHQIQVFIDTTGNKIFGVEPDCPLYFLSI